MSNIRKDEEMYRFLFVEGNAYYKHQLAEFLGMTDHHFDKYYRSFKKELQTFEPNYLIETKKNKCMFHRLKYDAYTFNKNVLISFYRKNHFSKSELERTAEIIRTLADGPKTFKELVEFIEGNDETNRTSHLRSLEYLKKIKVVKKENEIYSLDNNLFEDLSYEELYDLYSFVHFTANTGIISISGYLLLDFLIIYMAQHSEEERSLDIYYYRFLHFARVLNEYKCHDLLKAISHQQYITFRYYSKKEKQKAHTKTAEDKKPKQIKVIPLFVIYEHQYGRWYLIGKDPNYQNYSTYKLEGISEIEAVEKISKELFESEYQNALERYKNSWSVSTEPEDEVELKFYFHSSSENQNINFIEQRVRQEKQHGDIIKGDDPNSFIFSIKTNGIKEIKPWILSFGSSVEVIKPDQLREEIKQEWQRILEEYVNV